MNYRIFSSVLTASFGFLFIASSAFGAGVKVRLIYGDEWSRAGQEVKATLSSSEFRTASKGKYALELVNADQVKNFNDASVSRKLPAIMVVSDKGQCFCVLDNVPHDIKARKLASYIGKADAIREEAEKKGLKTADDCGEFLQKLERYVGGPWRIVSKGFYEDVFEKLKKLDPNDQTGWIRHFELGKKVELTDKFGKKYTDGGWKADGLGIVIKANNYRERSNFIEGEKYLQREQKELPARHLSLEQKQSLLMARFALYREDKTKRDEMLKLLRRIADAGEETFWGTSAVGWMNWLGQPPLSTYWGWHTGDFKGPKLSQTVKFGVTHDFVKAGFYTITFDCTTGASPRFSTLQLFAGEEMVAKIDKPQVEGTKTTFEYQLPREYAKGRITSMLVSGTADNIGATEGRITIARRVLKPRKVVGGSLPSLGGAKDGQAAASYIAKTVGKDALTEIAKNEGGADFLRKFFSDTEWMEQFAGSGMWSIKPWKGLKEDPADAQGALKTLDALVWNDKGNFIGTKLGRNIATALALNHGADWPLEKNVQVMECYREWAKDGTLHSTCFKHDVRKWREIMGFGQNAELPVESLRWIHDFANLPAGAYYGLCWSCDYRLWNCFGASVHGSDYYRPWQHRWNTQELRYRVGGVCGGLSKFGSHGAASHGIRSFTAGQPGHCAYMLWDFPTDRWGVAYAVTAHTMPHNSLGGPGLAALQEQNRYYLNPKRMDAERLRWKGEYEKAMRLCPGNYHAGVGWIAALEKNGTPDAWDTFGKTICETFNGFPSQGWMLYLAYLDHVTSKPAKLAAAKRALLAIRESPEKTCEDPYFDEIALTPLDKKFPNDMPSMWGVLDAALTGQAKTPSFYRQTINWGAARMMTDATNSKKFLTVVGKSALKTGEQLDYQGMILKASDSEDVQMWRQVYTLMDKLNPKLALKKGDKVWPNNKFGGDILSQDGLLKISNTSNWDNPVNWRNALDVTDYQGGNAFHTGKNNGPWGMVVLPGSSDIMGITVVNTPGNQTRQVPLVVSLSDDGKDFKEVFTSEDVQTEWNIQLPTPIKAKYIRVGRKYDETSGEHLFHLHKILVYGKKLY